MGVTQGDTRSLEYSLYVDCLSLLRLGVGRQASCQVCMPSPLPSLNWAAVRA